MDNNFIDSLIISHDDWCKKLNLDSEEQKMSRLNKNTKRSISENVNEPLSYSEEIAKAIKQEFNEDEPHINLKKSKSLLKNLNFEYKYNVDEEYHEIYYEVILNGIHIGIIKIYDIAESKYSFKGTKKRFVFFGDNNEINKMIPNELSCETLDNLKELLYNKVNNYISVIKKWEQ